MRAERNAPAIEDAVDPTARRAVRPGLPKYPRETAFQDELRRRVDAFFADTGQQPRDCWQIYLKTVILLTAFFGSYALLVFAAQTWWQALSLAILLGLASAAIGLNVQHDGGHHAFSRRPWVNRMMAMSLDLLGASSYLWNGKHVVLHHTYTNITGHDTDIDLGILGRLAPHHKRRGFHRWQHYYLWPFYGFMAIQWQLYNDFQEVITGKIHEHAFPRPRGWALVTFVVGKLVFLSLAFGIPMLFHPWWVVLCFYGVSAFVLGIVLAVVFQLAHCVEQAEFPLPGEQDGRMERSWAAHQVATTVDFNRGNRAVTWLLGGLNFQIEHHLLPRVCHVHYPALSRVVEGTCREFGLRYAEHRTFWSGLASHYRWLRRMGAADGSKA